MIDFFLEYGLSNLLVSVVLALIAWLVHRRGNRPFVARLLWLFVLVKMLLPPLVTVPLLTIPCSEPDVTIAPLPNLSINLNALPASPPELSLSTIEDVPVVESTVEAWLTIDLLKLTLGGLWGLGSLLVFGVSVYRIRQFDCSLRNSSSPAPLEIQSVAAGLARGFGLERSPTIYWTKAKLSPMLWWIGGAPRIFIPEDFARSATPSVLRWILAHELGHFSRGDHLTRIIEWLSCVAFWWNPVAWFARRNLRMNEELCCDALVLSKLKATPQQYAHSLLSIIEYLASSTLRPPAMASGINSGGNLERRFRMIVSKSSLPKAPRWLPAVALFCMVGFLPLGVAHAQSPDYEAVGSRLLKAVEKGELSASQAKSMMGELARSRFGERLDALAQKHHSGKKHSKAKKKASAPNWDRIVGGFEAIGIDRQTVRRVAGALSETGIKKDKLPKVMTLMGRFLYGVKNGHKTDKDNLSPALKKLGLNGEQFDKVWSLTKRLSGVVKSKKGNQKKKTQGTKKRDLAGLKKRYQAIEKKIWGAVKSGKMSKKDAAKKLKQLKKQMFGGQRQNKSDRRSNDARNNMEQMKRRYQAIEKELWQMVKAGKLSKQDAQKKLEALRQRIEGAQRWDKQRDKMRPDNRSMEARKKAFEAAKERIIAAVKAGKMSRAEGGETLAKMRQKLFGNVKKPKTATGERRRAERKDAQPRREKPDAEKRRMEAKVKKYRAVLKKMEAAVKAGKM
ncbi:MAG: M56 family metallopeptidase, partial [Planctomycetota bacterium]|nr:M56 family metallopeptidase [Planctomycetota bacterium]